MSDGSRQLALPFVAAKPRFRAVDFLAAPANEVALRWLGDTGAWPLGRLALSGAAGAGKTHLLHGWAERNDAAVLEGGSVRGPARVAGPIAVDDADLAPEPQALLHLLNDAGERGVPVLLTGRLAASRWPVPLADLRSRLRATVCVEIREPDDALLRALLARLFAERQLTVSEAVQGWLLLRLPRSGAAMREAVCRLDRAALAAGRKVDLRLAAAVVAELVSDDDALMDAVPVDSRRAPGLL